MNHPKNDTSNETIINDVVYLKPETFSFSPFFQYRNDCDSKSVKILTPEQLNSKTIGINNSSQKKPKVKELSFNIIQSFLSSRLDDNKCYDINDISFLELGGNDE